MEYSPLRRLVRKLTKENLWLYILALLRESPLYGYEIKELIERKFGFSPGMVTCYIVLYKLESEGLIESMPKKESAIGPPRKYYRITKDGIRALDGALEFLERTLTLISKGGKA